MLNSIFIIYSSRSGSTYLSALLNAHNDILACPEADVLAYNLLQAPDQPFARRFWIKRINHWIKTDDKLKIWGFIESDSVPLLKAKNNWEAFSLILSIYKNKVKPSAKFISFKSTLLSRNIGKLIDIKNTYFIYLERDPRAIYLSQRKAKMEQGFNFSNNPIVISYRWKQNHSIFETYKTKPNFIKIRFEDLIEHTNLVLNSIYNLIGAKHIDPQKTIIPNPPQVYRNEIHPNIGLLPQIKTLNEWQKHANEQEVIIIQYCLQKTLTKEKYQILHAPKLRRKKYAAYHIKNQINNLKTIVIFFMFTIIRKIQTLLNR